MFVLEDSLRAPPDAQEVFLGRTLPSLLEEACDRTPNAKALNQWSRKGWQSLSNQEFYTAASELAAGMLSLGLKAGDRVALLMHSNISFCISDMACLMAQLVDVPIDLTQTIDNIAYILHHSEARLLIASDMTLLAQVIPHLKQPLFLQNLLLAQMPAQDAGIAHPIPIQNLESIRLQGKKILAGHSLERAVAPQDLATILYIASPTGIPRGVMLTHENIAADILAAFDSHPNLLKGDQETALIFLPLTHIFARAFLYGHINYGHSVYFSTPSRVVQHLKDVKPTILITVPRLLEKIYSKLLEAQDQLKRFDRATYRWAINLAKQYRIGPLPRRYALQHRLADRLVFGKWRQVFGGRLKTLISGGAALQEDLTQVFLAAGIPVKQGYGLTESSAVVCYNRGSHQQIGTVGVPIAGVEVAIARDGEILVKAPYTTSGYYKDPQATQAAFNKAGWFHTGDLGEVTSDGFLKITGVKKPLFKLSTGKYVTPIPLEKALRRSRLVDQAVIVGANRKFCGVLIFPNMEALHRQVQEMGLDLSGEPLLKHPCISALFQVLVDQANCHLPYWSSIRRFQLVHAPLTVENGLLTETGQINHARFFETFAPLIEGLYSSDVESREEKRRASEDSSFDLSACPTLPAASCPASAQSLTHY